MMKISSPVVLEAAGSPPKKIEEYVGRLATRTEQLSVARMVSPSGWSEPAQTPEFDEYTIVLRGELEVRTASGAVVVRAGQAVLVSRGERVAYATPGRDGAEYIAVCLPAFSPALAHRDPV